MAYGDEQPKSRKFAAAVGAMAFVGIMAYGLNTASQVTPSPPRGPQWITANGSAKTGMTVGPYRGPPAHQEQYYQAKNPEGSGPIEWIIPTDEASYQDSAPTGYEYHANIPRDFPRGMFEVSDETQNGKLKVLRFLQLPARTPIATAYLDNESIILPMPEGSYVIQVAQGYGYDSKNRMPASDVTVNEGPPMKVAKDGEVTLTLSLDYGEKMSRKNADDFSDVR